MATRAGTIYKQHEVTQTTNTTKQEEMAMGGSSGPGWEQLMAFMQQQAEERREELISIVSAGIPKGVSTAVPKLQKLDQNDDIEAYLVTFERAMAASEIPEGRWPYILAPLLTGKAQQAYASIQTYLADDYSEV